MHLPYSFVAIFIKEPKVRLLSSFANRFVNNLINRTRLHLDKVSYEAFVWVTRNLQHITDTTKAAEIQWYRSHVRILVELFDPSQSFINILKLQRAKFRTFCDSLDVVSVKPHCDPDK